MDLLKNTVLFLGGLLNVGILLTIAILVILILWARKRGDSSNKSYLSDGINRDRDRDRDDGRNGGAR